MHRTPRLAVRALTGLLLSGTMVLVGCTATTESKPAPSPSATATFPGMEPGVLPATEVPTDVPNDPAERDNVTVSGCEQTDTGWSAAGTATNPTASEVTYRVTVFFTTEAATVLAAADTTVTVGAEEEAEWKISSDFTAAESTRCVLTGVATTS